MLSCQYKDFDTASSTDIIHSENSEKIKLLILSTFCDYKVKTLFGI